MVFASYYDGAAVSPVRLGEGVQGDTTSAVKLHIARGFRPLYIVISGSRHSMLDVSGWTKRVELLVVATNPEWPIAVAGLPADRVRFVDRNSCSGMGNLDRLYEAAAAHRRSQFCCNDCPSQFRMPEVIGGYEPETLTIADTSVEAIEYKSHTHGSVPSWFNNASNAADYDRGGVADVTLDGLITPVAATMYKVLPDRAGIGQLICDGKIEGQYDGQYRIVAPIELPGACAARCRRPSRQRRAFRLLRATFATVHFVRVAFQFISARSEAPKSGSSGELDHHPLAARAFR